MSARGKGLFEGVGSVEVGTVEGRGKRSILNGTKMVASWH